MFVDGGRIPLPLVLLVPLIVIVKNQRYHLLEFRDETIAHNTADRHVEFFIEQREVVETVVDFPGQEPVSRFKFVQPGPDRMLAWQAHQLRYRAQFDHHAEIGELDCEIGREPHQLPAIFRTSPHETETAEGGEKLLETVGRHPELTRQFRDI